MAREIYDRVKETTTTTGTSALALLGPTVGYVAFSAVLGDADTVYYAIWNLDVLAEWEVGLGTYASAGPTLTRTTVLASSNGNAAVVFSAGRKEVWGDAPAVVLAKVLQTFTSTRIPYVGSDGNFTDSADLVFDSANVALGLGGVANINGTVQITVDNASTGAAAVSGYYMATGTAGASAFLGVYDVAGSPLLAWGANAGITDVYYGGPLHTFRSQSGATTFAVIETGDVRPGVDITSSCGTASFRWTVVYAQTALINTSDLDEKTNLGSLNDAELRVGRRLSKMVSIWQYRDAIAEKGAEDARWHTGWVAQDVLAAFAAEKLSPFAYGCVGFDELNRTATTYVEIEGHGQMPLNKVVPDVDENGKRRLRLNVRPEYLVAFVIAAMDARISALEGI